MIIALYEPDIPQNTGTILRLGACLGVAVHIVGPAAFPANEKAFRRAGLDYLDHVSVVNHVSFGTFEDWRKQEGRRIVLLSTKASSAHIDLAYRDSDVLFCGRESAGVPEEVHRAADERVKDCRARPLRGQSEPFGPDRNLTPAEEWKPLAGESLFDELHRPELAVPLAAAP